LAVGLFIPIVVQRPLMTLKAGCPSPLMAAAGATAFRQKRVPHRSASFEGRLWTAHAVTTPSARRCRTPTAQWTSDSAERLALLSGYLPVAEAVVLEKLNGHVSVHIVSDLCRPVFKTR
jgi:hypothetical protein